MIKGNEISLLNEIIKIVHVLKILEAEKTLKSPHLMVKNCFVDFHKEITYKIFFGKVYLAKSIFNLTKIFMFFLTSTVQHVFGRCKDR